MDYSTGNEDLERLLLELKMNIPAISSPNVDDRRMRDDGNPIIAKMAAMRTRGERNDNDAAGEVPVPPKAAMFDDDIEETIRRGKFGDYGFLDSLMEEMARQQRKAQGLPE